GREAAGVVGLSEEKGFGSAAPSLPEPTNTLQAQPPDAWCAGAPVIEVWKCVRGAVVICKLFSAIQIDLAAISAKILDSGIVNQDNRFGENFYPV
ncbi:hypothetical protein U1Q18_004269, partial [Sarracenia purpurea var. burkii]